MEIAQYAYQSVEWSVPQVHVILVNQIQAGGEEKAEKMDLVDIDKLLDEFESSEQTSSSTDKRIQSSDTNRRIKVRSVLSSLNDYVDYDRKQNDKSATAPPVPGTSERIHVIILIISHFITHIRLSIQQSARKTHKRTPRIRASKQLLLLLLLSM